MAIVTKTYYDNTYNFSQNRKYWNVTYSFTDITAIGNDFKITCPSIVAKFNYVSSYLSYVNYYQLGVYVNTVKIGDYSTNFGWNGRNYDLPAGSSSSDAIALGEVNTNYTLTPSTYLATQRTIRTNNIFTSSNKTTRVVDVVFNWRLKLLTTDSSYPNTSESSIYSSQYEDFVVGTVTLDVPPTATLGTPTYAIPYASVGAYTVPITSAEAYYGGDISKVTLTVGQDSTVQTYSTPTISNQTISVTPTIAGTYTPTVTIEDSRGQIATHTLPQITVNPYNVPSVSFDVYRTNNIGIKNDEGHYALIQSTISYTDAIATLTEPSIQIDGVDLSSLANASVTWYKTWSNTSGVSNVISNWTTLVPQNHTVTIYGLIDWKYSTTGNFAEDISYQITLVANDSLNGHSTPITQTMSTAFYTIDFQAGGKEIAFGAPANDSLTSHPNGLFKCAMDAQFGGNAKFDGNVGFDGDVEFGGNVVGIRGSVIGEIKAYAGLSIPDGWLECDGSEVSKTKYPNLYVAIGDLWGVPNSSSNFKLPNLKGRVPVGHDSTDENFGTVGGTGGAKSRELCAAIGACNDGPSTLGYIADAPTTYQSSNGASYVVRGASFESMRHWNHSTPVTERYSSNRATSFLQPYAVIKYIICAI